MKRTFVSFLLLSSFLLTPLFAGNIEGVSYTTLTINGQTYDVPLANKSYEQDIYWVKRILGGDKEALSIFVGGLPKRTIFIGDTDIRWLTVYADGTMYVTEP